MPPRLGRPGVGGAVGTSTAQAQPAPAGEVWARLAPAGAAAAYRSYLVDPASSHMLVSKIKPCMSKYKQFIL